MMWLSGCSVQYFRATAATGVSVSPRGRGLIVVAGLSVAQLRNHHPQIAAIGTQLRRRIGHRLFLDSWRGGSRHRDVGARACVVEDDENDGDDAAQEARPLECGITAGLGSHV